MGIWAAVKYALNSTLGTSNFLSLDKIIQAHGTQTFTKDGTFTVPDGVTKILVTAFGGGGGGNFAGGQGGSWILRKAFSVVPRTTIPITIGAGGTGQENRGTSTAGTDGGATVIGNLITLAGGVLGGKTIPVGHNGAQGGDYDFDSRDSPMSYGGAPGDSDGDRSGGGGGGAGYGRGGNGGDGYQGTYGYSGDDGGIGAGGGGGGSSNRYMGRGGNGGNGIVIIEW